MRASVFCAGRAGQYRLCRRLQSRGPRGQERDACLHQSRRDPGTGRDHAPPDAALAAAAPAIVGGDLRDDQGRPERGSRRDRLTLWRAVTSFTGLTRFGFRDFNRHTDPLLSNAPAPTGAISGALFVIRRADFDRLGGFDEGYFLHVEDLDLCRRAEDAGIRVLFAPGPHGRHLRSSSDADARDIARHKARSMARYFNKFAKGPERALAAVAGWVLVGVVGR
ncbi:MAG: glycosyltransferase family 2 protein [Caulobacteraceae bacterium]|nr:glycosyltransferase family 2 protein [Caulobacteraceae bacterium]